MCCSHEIGRQPFPQVGDIALQFFVKASLDCSSPSGSVAPSAASTVAVVVAGIPAAACCFPPPNHSTGIRVLISSKNNVGETPCRAAAFSSTPVTIISLSDLIHKMIIFRSEQKLEVPERPRNSYSH